MHTPAIPVSFSSLRMADWRDCLGQLRDARAMILRDAECYDTAATVLERIGQCLCSEIRFGMGKYRTELHDLASCSGGEASAQFDRLFEVVKEARNMAVHEGVWARHLSSRLVDLFLILERAILTKMKNVEDLMVRSPQIAEDWQPVATARRAMLGNSFSALPILWQGQWSLITDYSIMRSLQAKDSLAEQNRILTMRIDDALKQKVLGLTAAVTCKPSAPIAEAVKHMTEHPTLVVDEISGQPRLLGILTPFDLL